MIFPEKKSALVRLSDCIKIGLTECENESRNLIEMHRKYAGPLRELRELARRQDSGDLSHEEAVGKMKEVNSKIPKSEALRVIYSKGALSSKAFSVVLNCCFCLESYINSLAYHLFHESDFLGLIRNGHDITSDILFEAIEKMSPPEKWETFGKLRSASGFDKSRTPFQDFRWLFNFRNDIVHDKATDFDAERSRKRYGSKLPDPVFGFLDLSHANYAPGIYWSMIEKLHSQLKIEMKTFQKHYNLSPWFNEGDKVSVLKTIKEFKEKVGTSSLGYER